MTQAEDFERQILTWVTCSAVRLKGFFLLCLCLDIFLTGKPKIHNGGGIWTRPYVYHRAYHSCVLPPGVLRGDLLTQPEGCHAYAQVQACRQLPGQCRSICCFPLESAVTVLKVLKGGGLWCNVDLIPEWFHAFVRTLVKEECRNLRDNILRLVLCCVMFSLDHKPVREKTRSL